MKIDCPIYKLNAKLEAIDSALKIMVEEYYRSSSGGLCCFTSEEIDIVNRIYDIVDAMTPDDSRTVGHRVCRKPVIKKVAKLIDVPKSRVEHYWKLRDLTERFRLMLEFGSLQKSQAEFIGTHLSKPNQVELADWLKEHPDIKPEDIKMSMLESLYDWEMRAYFVSELEYDDEISEWYLPTGKKEEEEKDGPKKLYTYNDNLASAIDDRLNDLDMTIEKRKHIVILHDIQQGDPRYPDMIFEIDSLEQGPDGKWKYRDGVTPVFTRLRTEDDPEFGIIPDAKVATGTDEKEEATEESTEEKTNESGESEEQKKKNEYVRKSL